MGICLYDESHPDLRFDANFWIWRTIVESIRRLRVIADARTELLYDPLCGPGGEPLAGARVRVSGREGFAESVSAAARADGRFRFERVPDVPLELTASADGHRDASLELPGPSTYGLVGPNAKAGVALRCFGATVVVAMALLAWHASMGWLVPQETVLPGEALMRNVRWLGSGLLVGALEEWFFRGWLLRRLGRVTAPLRAALLASAVFAVLHAFKPSNLRDLSVSHDAAGAFEAMGAWLGVIVDPLGFGPSLVGLFLLGMALTAAYLRMRTLWAPIAIHAAGIWVIYAHGAFTDRAAAPLWGGSKHLYDAPPVWLLLAAVALWLWPRPARSEAVPRLEAPGTA